MKKLYSNADDCFKLSKHLKKEMGNKIKFLGSTYQEVISGEYFSNYRKTHSKFGYLLENGLPFYYKFCKDGFLRITISSLYPNNNSMGEKLAALSSFYEVLNAQFGEPTVFFTLKDDEESSITLHWSFANKEEEIQSFRNGNYFDDNELDELIVIGEPAPQNENYQLIEETKKEVARKIGLPFELTHLIDEDFVKYKTGKEIELPKVYQDECSEPQKRVFTIDK